MNEWFVTQNNDKNEFKKWHEMTLKERIPKNANRMGTSDQSKRWDMEKLEERYVNKNRYINEKCEIANFVYNKRKKERKILDGTTIIYP